MWSEVRGVCAFGSDVGCCPGGGGAVEVIAEVCVSVALKRLMVGDVMVFLI